MFPLYLFLLAFDLPTIVPSMRLSSPLAQVTVLPTCNIFLTYCDLAHIWHLNICFPGPFALFFFPSPEPLASTDSPHLKKIKNCAYRYSYKYICIYTPLVHVCVFIDVHIYLYIYITYICFPWLRSFLFHFPGAFCFLCLPKHHLPKEFDWTYDPRAWDCSCTFTALLHLPDSIEIFSFAMTLLRSQP